MAEGNLIYTVQPDVEVLVDSIGADLIVEGYNKAEVRASGDDPSVHVEENGRRVHISCVGDCRLRVPAQARVMIASVGSDIKISNITGDITVDNIGSDCWIADVGKVTVGTVGSDLEIKRTNGDVVVHHVGADAEFKEISGKLSADSIGSDALLKNVSGNCAFDHVGGDLALEMKFQHGSEHHFDHVGGDVLIQVESDASVKFIVPNHAERSIEGAEAWIETQDDLSIIVLAEGAAVVRIDTIGGELQIEGEGGRGLGGFIEDVIEDFIPENLGAKIAGALDGLPDQLERQAERMRRDADRMRREAERMQSEAQRAAEKAKSKSKRGRGFTFDFSFGSKNKRGPTSPPPPPGFGRQPEPPAEPISDQERMLILRMVESKQISVEEAERLLAALEGRA